MLILGGGEYRGRCFEFARRDGEDIDSLRQHIFDVVDLLGGIVVGVGLHQVIAPGLGLVDDRLRFGEPERVAVADLRPADGVVVLFRNRRTIGRQRRAD